MSEQQKLARSAGIFTGATMVSRILGYARDSMVANFFGAGAMADAFYAAFRISNLFRRLLGEGALSVAFIPVFSKTVETEGPEAAQRLFNVVFTALAALCFTLMTLGIVFAAPLTRVIAMGFDPARFELTVTLTRWMMPFLLFISVAALLTGVLNALRSFFWPAFAPAMLSVAEIVYLLCFARLLPVNQQIIGLAISVAVGGLLQFAIHVPDLRAKGISLRWHWDPNHPGLRRISRLMLPATLGSSVDQIDAFINTICASFLQPGALAALYYSNRIMQLPLALFGIAMSQVALPSMSASVARGDTAELKETLNYALRFSLVLILPAMTGLLVLGRPIVQVLFEHGAFKAAATTLTVKALSFYSIGLFAYSAVKILAGAFYAEQNTSIPVRVAAGCMALNIILNLSLMRTLGVGGLALATSIASIVNASLLYWLLHKRLGPLGGRRILITFTKSAMGCLAMTAVCGLSMREGLFTPLVRLLVGSALGSLVYFGVAFLLRMEELSSFSFLRRRKTV